MAKSGKCRICALWAELTSTGHLTTHKPKDFPASHQPCKGSRSLPMAPEPKADETKPAAKATAEKKPKPEQEPVITPQQEPTT